MKVKVNIINMSCISMSEAVNVPSLIMMTSIVSKESLARDTHTQTDRQVSSKLKFAVAYNFAKKNKERKKPKTKQ